MNEALAWCQGVYLSTVASDDVLCPQKTKLQVEYLRYNLGVSGVFGNVIVITGKEGSGLLSATKNSKKRQYAVYTFKDVFFQSQNLPAATCLLRLSDVLLVGGYNENVGLEDRYMWLKLTQHGGKLVRMPDTLALYRQHGGNTSSNAEYMIREKEKLFQLYRDHPLYKQAYARHLMYLSRHAFKEKHYTHGFKVLAQGCSFPPALFFQKNLHRCALHL